MADNKLDHSKSQNSDSEAISQTIFNGIRFNTRIILFFLISLLSAIVLAGILINAEKTVGGLLAKIKYSYSMISTVSRLDTGVTSLENISESFILTKQIGFKKKYEEKSAELSQITANTLKNSAARGIRKILSGVSDNITNHATKFQNIIGKQTIIGENNKVGLIKQVNKSGTTLQKQINQSVNIKLIYEINRIRILESKINININLDSAKIFLDSIANLRQSIMASPLSRQIKLSLDKTLKVYASDSERLAQTKLLQSREIAQMREAGDQLRLDITSLKAYAKKLDGRSIINSTSTLTKLKVIVLIGALLVIVFITFSGIILMLSFTKPIRLLVKAASQIVNSSQHVLLPVANNQDETGELSSILAFFRDNLARAELSRRDLEEQLEKYKTNLNTKLNEFQPSIGENKAKTEKKLENNQPTPKTITLASRKLAQTSQGASEAARTAEKCDQVVEGLTHAITNLGKIELLLISNSDQMGLLSVQAAISFDKDTATLPKELDEVDKNADKAGSAFLSDNINLLQTNTNKAVGGIKEVGNTIRSINKVVAEMAMETSTEALESANELLKQSEDLRQMLDNILEKVKN